MFRRLMNSLAFRWILSVITGCVAYLVQTLFPEMGWLKSTALVFVAAIIIGRLLKPYKLASRPQRARQK